MTGIQSAISYASSYIEASKKKSKLDEPDRADFNPSKRRIEWHIRNFRGEQERELELSMTFKKGVIIDEL